jgi:uncharacterized protein YeaO (DUF488 family)
MPPTSKDDSLIRIKRAYAKPALSDGVRVLVESAWPRGLGKEAARVDHWFPELAPSATLTKWLKHRAEGMMTALERKYFAELRTPKATEAMEQLYNYLLREKTITLLHAAEEAEWSGAVLLKNLLDGHRKPPSNTGPAKAAAAVGRARAVARRPRR